MLKTVFLKMSTIMDKPLSTIMKAGSEDFESVAKYYSGQLFEYVKNVLAVIPRSIFKELDLISSIMSDELRELEVKINKDVLKSSIQMETRYTLAKKTHEITLLTEGMLRLDNVLMGVIEIEPKDILVDGLRRELCKTLAKILHEGFIFKVKAKAAEDQIETNAEGIKIQGGRAAFGEFGDKFQSLKSKFVGLKRSIEYIQDFLNVQGEKLWREELARIIELAVEKEATRLVNKKYQANLNDDESIFIPEFEPLDETDFTFMGRLLTAVLKNMSDGFYLD